MRGFCSSDSFNFEKYSSLFVKLWVTKQNTVIESNKEFQHNKENWTELDLRFMSLYIFLLHSLSEGDIVLNTSLLYLTAVIMSYFAGVTWKHRNSYQNMIKGSLIKFKMASSQPATTWKCCLHINGSVIII